MSGSVHDRLRWRLHPQTRTGEAEQGPSVLASAEADDGSRSGLGRREFCTLMGATVVVSAAASPAGARPQPHEGGGGGDHRRRHHVGLYVSTGPLLARYRVDDEALTLRRAEAVALPAAVQYVWPHPRRRLLYAAYSDQAGADPGTVHGVDTLAIDERGVLHPVASRAFPSRPIHITVDATGRWLLVAYNAPSAVEVYPLDARGVPGPVVVQNQPVDAGVYAHQVRVAPSNRTVIVSARGNDATPSTPEAPGALLVFDLVNGQLRAERSVAPDGGYGFGPRHVDFDERRPRLFVSDERSNELHVFRTDRDGVPAPEPRHSLSTLVRPGTLRGQVAGPIHVADDGRHVYLANRADATTDVGGQQVFAGGENSIAVFRVDGRTGRPTRIQNAPTESFHVRTFALHPAGRMLVAASVAPMLVQGRSGIREVPARLTVFRVKRDGRLDLARTYDVDTSAGRQFWCGMVRF